MQKENIPLITGLVCSAIIILDMINIFAINKKDTSQVVEQFCWADIHSNRGFKPVMDECPNIEDEEVLQDNFLYKEWCEETFNNGTYIYEGYKDIAFKINYESEADKTDIWQTPSETSCLQKGDCEDAVFLFFSHLSPYQENAEIVWGWVINNKTGLARAHVWYQLSDNKGRQYVVEGFSNDWNGIIPMDIVKNTETRISILNIKHVEASRLASLIRKPDSLKAFQMSADLHRSTDLVNNDKNNKYYSKDAYTRYHRDSTYIENRSMSREFKSSWVLPLKQRFNITVSKEITKIFIKLHVLFTRYEKQMEGFSENSYFTERSENTHSSRNLICRR